MALLISLSVKQDDKSRLKSITIEEIHQAFSERANNMEMSITTSSYDLEI